MIQMITVSRMAECRTYCIARAIESIESVGTLEDLLYSNEAFSNNKTELDFRGLQLF